VGRFGKLRKNKKLPRLARVFSTREGEGAVKFALILFVILLVAVYFTYQIIETAFFELFIINLPF